MIYSKAPLLSTPEGVHQRACVPARNQEKLIYNEGPKSMTSASIQAVRRVVLWHARSSMPAPHSRGPLFAGSADEGAV
jgi:hypothetical protein